MSFLTFLVGTIMAGVVLFLWSGIQNSLPWGLGVLGNGSKNENLPEALKADIGRTAIVTSPDVAALIAVRAGNYYSLPRYFAIEFATQLAVGGVIMGILALTDDLSDGSRLLLVGLAALSSILSSEVQYWNWWGLADRSHWAQLPIVWWAMLR